MSGTIIITGGRHGKQAIILPGQQQQQYQPQYQQPQMMQMHHGHHGGRMMGYGQQVIGHHHHNNMSVMSAPQMNSGFSVPNCGVGMQYNRWARPNFNYATMPGYCNVDYTGGWNPNVHDMMLKNKINQVFMQYDMNRNGQLEGPEFYGAYRDLCLMMGMAPPQSQQEVWQVAMQTDLNGDGMISPMEMFILFKKLQGINSGMMMQPGMMSMAW